MRRGGRPGEAATSWSRASRTGCGWRTCGGFRSKEIAEAELAGEDEDARLETEKRVLTNAEKLYTAAMSAHELLYEGEDSAEATLRRALKQVGGTGAVRAASLRSAAQQLAAAKAAVEDVGAAVRDFAETTQASPERLEEIEDRLAALDRLKRKYGQRAVA